MSNETEEFLEFLYGEEKGYVLAPLKTVEDEWKQAMFQWPNQKEELINYLMLNSAKGHDVYCAPALFNTNKSSRPFAKGSNTIYCDFDGNSIETFASWPSNLPEPTLRVQTSEPGREHVYWKLDSFCTDVSAVEDINRSLAVKFSADRSGWEITQVLRPPGTTHNKNPDAQRVVRVLESNNVEVTLKNFATLERHKLLIRQDLSLEDLPSIVEVMLASPPWKDKYIKILTGETKVRDRSNAMAHLAHYCCELGLDDKQIMAVIKAYDDRVKKFTNRRDRGRRLADIVNNARVKRPVKNANDEAEVLPQRTVFSYEDFFLHEAKFNWLFENLIFQGSFNILVGPPNVGKTQLGLQFCRDTALGTQFLDWRNARGVPSKVLFLSLEMSHPELKELMQHQRPTSLELRSTLDQNFYIAPVGSSVYLDREEGYKAVKRIIEHLEIEVLVIDSFSRTLSGSLSDDVVIRSMVQHITSLGVTTFLIHHPRKADAKGRSEILLDDIYGNVFLGAALDTLLTMIQVEDRIELGTAKTRMSAPQETRTIIRNKETLTYYISAELNRPEVTASKLFGFGGDM